VTQLTLLRHAKSSWADDGQEDRARSLSARGRKAGRGPTRYVRDQGISPDLVLCSPAARTTETLELVRPGLAENVHVQIEESLYGAGARELLERLRGLPESVEWAMVIGHNPGLQQLVVILASDGPRRDRPPPHFPTGALATMRLREGTWADLGPGRAELVSYVAPRELP
jgi:phosphohistidine phosphatase